LAGFAETTPGLPKSTMRVEGCAAPDLAKKSRSSLTVIPAKAGIQCLYLLAVPK